MRRTPFAAIAAATAFLALGVGPAFADTIVVDAPNPELECPNADSATINGAVALAQPGDRIRVCPGLYPENVIVNKPDLRLDGSGPDPRRRTGDPTRESVIEYPVAGIGVMVVANNVEFEGFTVRPAAGVLLEGTGLYTSPLFSGYEIERSLFTQNTMGVYFNSSGVLRSEVERNAFNNNNLPGAAQGNGVYSDQGLRNARIEDNYFTNNQNAGIVLTTFTTQIENVEVAHNRSVSDGSLIAVFDTSMSRIHHNDVEASEGSGIFVGPSNVGLLIEHNKLRNGMARGIRFNTTFFPGPPSTGLVVAHNDVRDMALDGIVAESSSVVSSEFDHNHVRNTGQDGLKLEPGNNGNVITHNRMRGSAIHDCHDSTLNTNVWRQNHGRTQNRPGLCRGAAVVGPPEH